MVRGAISAARSEAAIGSPSKKMLYIGEMMRLGLMRLLWAAERDMDAFMRGIISAGGVSGGFAMPSAPAPRFAAFPAIASGGGQPTIINNHYHQYVLHDEDWVKVQQNAKKGAEMATLGYQLGLS